MERKVFFRPGALERFARCSADEATKRILKRKIEDLKNNPHLGIKVPFQAKSQFYQLRIPIGNTTYWVHYVFDDNEVLIGYLGVPGRC
jgi:hypothetical protein